MVKLRGPLSSLSAQGTVAGILTFSRRKLKNLCRYQKKQKDVTTSLRTTQRGYFQEAVEQWHILSDAEQKQWHDFVKDP